MNGEEMRTDDPHAIELRDAQDPETPVGRLQQLEVSTYSDVRLEVAANYTFRLARHLLALHLAHGASVTVEMTNQYRCWDGLAIRVSVGGSKGAWTWDLRMYDPDFDDRYIDSQLFNGIVMNRVAPEGPSEWSEFRFSDPRPDWDDIESMMYSEGLDDLTDSSPAWPDPVNGHDFHVWALVLLRASAELDSGSAVRFLRNQDSLPSVGSVDVRLQSHTAASAVPGDQMDTATVQHMVRFLRSDEVRESSDPFFRKIGIWARQILEPMIAADSLADPKILMTIAEDPSCPAMNIMRVATKVPDHIKAIAALGSPDPLYGELWQGPPEVSIEGARLESDTHEVPEDHSASPDIPFGRYLTSSRIDSTAMDELAGLLSRIDDLAPEWLNDDDEDSLGYFLQRHKSLLQVLLWLRREPHFDAGDIAVHPQVIIEWTEALQALIAALEPETDYERVEALAFESWLSQDEVQPFRRTEETDRLISKAQQEFLSRDFESARSTAKLAMELGSVEAIYLAAIFEALLGDFETYEALLRAAAAFGHTHAMGELGSLDCQRGDFALARERLMPVPLDERNVSVWIALSWALLVTDRSSDYLHPDGVEGDEQRLKSIFEEHPPFVDLGLWHEHQQIGFFANHLACAFLNRELTEFEIALMETLIKRSEGVSEIVLLNAYIAESSGDLEKRNSLLSRLTTDETERLGRDIDDAAGHTPPDSQARTYFESLQSLLSLK